MESTRTAVPNLPGTRDWFNETVFSMDGGEWGWFWDDSSALHLLCTLFLSVLHQFHLRSVGIRSQRLGTPVLWNHLLSSEDTVQVPSDTDSKLSDREYVWNLPEVVSGSEPRKLSLVTGSTTVLKSVGMGGRWAVTIVWTAAVEAKNRRWLIFHRSLLSLPISPSIQTSTDL